MNNFDKIYIINLKHRTDRKNSIIKLLHNLNIDNHKIQFIDAVYTPNFGIYGCIQSHYLCVNNFINDNSINNCVILEDDWKYNNIDDFNQKINLFLNNYKNNYDGFFIYSAITTNIINYQKTNIPQLYKVNNNMITATAYALNNKDCAKFLLQKYKTGIDNLSVYNRKITKNTFKKIQRLYSSDVVYNDVFKNFNWYFFYPNISSIIDSYSDIETI